MPISDIIIKGAREHNLQDIDLLLPRNQLICFTGVSGSGKSSLAFDTLYAEGQRRYVESLSSFARQFLGQLPRPDVDSVTGLSPSISIAQKSAGHNPRSTVATMTEIHDFLRVLYARVGTAHCPTCDRVLEAQPRDQIVERIFTAAGGQRVMILAPLVRQAKGEHRDLFTDLVRQGFTRARVCIVAPWAAMAGFSSPAYICASTHLALSTRYCTRTLRIARIISIVDAITRSASGSTVPSSASG